MHVLKAVAAALALLLAGCGEQGAAPTFHPEANPPLLSEWGQFARAGSALAPAEGVLPYEINMPLFSDYAEKLRTVWSVGGAAAPNVDGSLDFPVGTVITKTFYYERDGDNVRKLTGQSTDGRLDLASVRLLETRLLVRRQDGWHPVAYVWNEDQTDAVLKRTGAVVPLTLVSDRHEQSFTYVVPNENQCAGCHASDSRTKALRPLGPTLQQLARPGQLTSWTEAGYLDRPGAVRPQAAWDDAGEIEGRARSYLAANCAHCHNPNGPADTSGLDLSLDARGAALGLCKPPIAAGSGTGGHRFSIEPGSAETSILRYRMASTDPGSMMPELGRSLVHEEGLALIEAWIDEMDGDCA